MKLIHSLAAFACVFLATAAGPASAQHSDEPEAVLLVASPRLMDSDYRQTVVLAVPIDNDRHLAPPLLEFPQQCQRRFCLRYNQHVPHNLAQSKLHEWKA